MKETFVYAARLKYRDKLIQSSSGGMFLPLSDLFLKRGYAVACAIYDVELHQTVFRLIQTKEEQQLAQGSKYMQSIPAEIFRTCIEWLETNQDKKLLFIGMGCQAAAFQRFTEVKKLRNRVVIVDIICHGSPSPKIWREYAAQLEKRNNGIIKFVSFKDKRNGWNAPYAYVKIGQKEISISDYVNLFYSQCILRPSCHECPYTKVERDTDMTIGDFWGIENVLPDYYSPDGNSLVLIHTEVGQQLFEEIKENLEVVESNQNDCLQPNLIAPTPVSDRRNTFWKVYSIHGLEKAMYQIFKPSLFLRVKRKLRNIIR